MEGRVSFLKDIHFGEEHLWVVALIYQPVFLAQGCPERRASLLTELAVEDDDCPGVHELAQFLNVAQEEPLEFLWGVNIDGTLDVAAIELIVLSTVHDNG